MTVWLAYFAVFAVLIGVWGWAHRPSWWTVAVYPVLCLALYFAATEVMGSSKPTWLEWREMGDVRVMAYVLDEPNAIHLWIDAGEPRAYVEPWSLKRAKELRGAAGQAEEDGTSLWMRFEYSEDTNEPLYYALPPVAPRPKN